MFSCFCYFITNFCNCCHFSNSFFAIPILCLFCLLVFRACSPVRKRCLTFTCVHILVRARIDESDCPPTETRDHTTTLKSVQSLPPLAVSPPHACHHEEQTRFKQSFRQCKGKARTMKLLNDPSFHFHHSLRPHWTPSLCPSSPIAFCIRFLFPFSLLLGWRLDQHAQKKTDLKISQGIHVVDVNALGWCALEVMRSTRP